jgi:hypothetical protein
MTVIASRPLYHQIFGIVAYLSATPILFLLAAVPGYLVGVLVANLFGMDENLVSDRAAVVSSVLLGLVLFYFLLREAWARVYTEVRLSKDCIEFERANKTYSWKLEKVEDFRVTVQSRRVGTVGLSEIAVCITGADGRRLHLTDLSDRARNQLLSDTAERMADRLSATIQKEPISFGPGWRDYLNVYKLGPILLFIGVPAAFDLHWLAGLLTGVYVGYLGWSIRRRGAVVTSDGIRFGGSKRLFRWADIRSTTDNQMELVVETSDVSYTVEGPNNLLPLAKLIARMRGHR